MHKRHWNPDQFLGQNKAQLFSTRLLAQVNVPLKKILAQPDSGDEKSSA
jgi:hypothetical protein